MKRYIPNLLSLTNATAGALGVCFAVDERMPLVLVCIVVALVADFLDGFMARLLKSFSPLGKDLDSLSDAISFGVLPAVLTFRMLQGLQSLPEWCAYVAFLIVPASVYRLAKFNHDERQSTSFIGLPTPANALFWLGAYYVGLTCTENATLSAHFLCYLMPLLVVLCSWLLVSEVPMFSLKGKHRTTIENIQLYAVLLVTLIAVVYMGISGLMIGIGIYILTNLLLWIVVSKARKI